MTCLSFEQLQEFVALLPATLDFVTAGIAQFTTPNGTTFEWVFRADDQQWCFNGEV